MTRLIFMLVLLAPMVAFGQGSIRRISTIAKMVQMNPQASAVSGKLTAEVVGYHAEGDMGGTGRMVDWMASSALATNLGNVFDSPFGGQWVFRDRNSPAQNAKWWSAYGNGTNDDTVAIQASIDSLPIPSTNSLFVERGGSILIPDGVYKITAPLRMRPGIIEGSSRFGTVLVNHGTTNDVISCMTPAGTPPTGIWLYRVAHMSIHQADATVPTAGAAIRVQSDDGLTASMADVEDVFIHGTFRGFHGSALQGSSLKNLTIYASKDDGILWDVYQTMVQASGCWTYYCGQNGTGHGWHLQGPAYCTVTASGADSNYGWGWYVESGTVQAPRGNNFTVGAEQNRDGGILIKNAIGGVYSPMVVTPDDLPTAANGIVVDNGRMVGLVGAFTQQGAIGGTGYPLRITNGVPDYPSVTVNASYLNSYNTGSEYHQTIGIGTYLPWEERGFIGLNTDGKPRRMLDVHDRTGAAGNTTGHELARLALHTADTNGNAYISITPDGETTFHRIIANNLRAATTFNYGTNGDTVFLGPSAPLSGDNGSFLFQLGTTPVMSIKGGDTLGGVGIGTTRPNPAALLDIRSSTRGLLLPSWASTEYTGGLYGSGSFTPPGLLSYDSTDRRVRVQTRNAADGLTNNQYTTLFGYVDRDLRLGTAHRQIGKIWPQSVHATDTNIGSVYIYFTAENVIGLEIEQNSFRAGPYQYGTFGDTIIRNSYSNSAGAYGNLLLMAGDNASVTIGNGTARGTVTISNDLVVADSITLGGVARNSWPTNADLLNGFDGSYYLNRANHNGSQSYTTITGLGDLAIEDYPPFDGDTYGINNGAWTVVTSGSSYTFSDGVTNSGGTITANLEPGDNISFATNSTRIRINAITSSSTNGTPVSVDGGAVLSDANFADTSEINHTASGTNISSALIDGSISTNRINPTFHGWISGKQDALTFSTGVTNDAGVIKAALSKGANIEFVTNANTIEISAVVPTGTNTWQIGVDGVIVTTPNVKATSEIDPSVSGTNVLLALVNNSISTNRIDTTFHQWVLSQGGSSVAVDGSAMSSVNLKDGSEIAVSATGTNVTASVVAGSLSTNRANAAFHQWVNDKVLYVHGTEVPDPNLVDTGTVEVTATGSNIELDVPDGSITYTKLQNVSATNRVIGLGSTAPGSAVELAVGDGLITSATDLKLNVEAGSGIELATNGNKRVTITSKGYTPVNDAVANLLLVTSSETVDMNSDDTFRDVTPTARSGMSTTIPAGTLLSGSVMKIEMAGEIDVLLSGWNPEIRVVLDGPTGTDYAINMIINEPGIWFPEDTTTWKAEILIVVNAAGSPATVYQRSHFLCADGAMAGSGSLAGYAIMTSGVPSNSLDTAVNNTIRIDYRGSSDGIYPSSMESFKVSSVIIWML